MHAHTYTNSPQSIWQWFIRMYLKPLELICAVTDILKQAYFCLCNCRMWQLCASCSQPHSDHSRPVMPHYVHCITSFQKKYDYPYATSQPQFCYGLQMEMQTVQLFLELYCMYDKSAVSAKECFGTGLHVWQESSESAQEQRTALYKSD